MKRGRDLYDVVLGPFRQALTHPARNPLRGRKPPKGKGGSEPVSVEPNRPKMGEGGAAAALEFDE